VIPHPESLAAQAAYDEALLPGSGLGPNYFQALGSATGSHIVNRGTTVAHNQSPGPTGTAAAECPRKKSQLAWEAPAAQIPQRAPSLQGRGLGRLNRG
jgi:hypothetical protein